MHIEIPLGDFLEEINKRLGWAIEKTDEYKEKKEEYSGEWYNEERALGSIKEYCLDELAEYLVRIALERGLEKYKKDR
jgi:hypothetical protein